MVRRFSFPPRPAMGGARKTGSAGRLVNRGFRVRAISTATKKATVRAMVKNNSRSLKGIIKTRKSARSSPSIKAARMAKTNKFLAKRGFVKLGTVRRQRLSAARANAAAKANAARRAAIAKGRAERFKARLAKARAGGGARGGSGGGSRMTGKKSSKSGSQSGASP